ncbi:aspartate aminotransferase family protein [Chloroflexota bacterium]
MTTARTKELLRRDTAHFLHAFANVGESPKLIWERGSGARLWDTDGREYIDMSSGGAQCTHLGFARKELNDAAYEQMQKISHVMSAPPYSSLPAIEYAKALSEVLPGDINHVFFTTSGTESNEAALKIAKLYWNARGQAAKYKIICLSDAYHGASHMTATLMGRLTGRFGFGPEAAGVVRVPHYHCYWCPFKLKYPSCNITCARFIERVIQQEGADSIACMIAEPIQGYAGIVWPPDEYWPIVNNILKEHSILLIADEVQNGFCRTGKFWGVSNWNITPDMMTMGKGINSVYLPLGAIGVSDKVWKDLKGHYLLAGGTASGHPVCVATAKAALKIYIKEKLDERAARLGKHIHDRLTREFLPLPCVDDIMGRGLAQSFEIALGKTTHSEFDPEAQRKTSIEIHSRFLEKGVYTRIEWDRRVYLTPPLIIGEDELDKALDIMLDVMKEVRPLNI